MKKFWGILALVWFDLSALSVKNVTYTPASGELTVHIWNNGSREGRVVDVKVLQNGHDVTNFFSVAGLNGMVGAGSGGTVILGLLDLVDRNEICVDTLTVCITESNGSTTTSSCSEVLRNVPAQGQ
jgi:archaellum component FlaF (FlaF/FlaG flagellin family)